MKQNTTSFFGPALYDSESSWQLQVEHRKQLRCHGLR